MTSDRSRHNAGAHLTALLGSVSLLTVASALPAFAGEAVAQAEEIPETVLITGSLIRGTAAVGVPVTNLSPNDFAQTGALQLDRAIDEGLGHRPTGVRLERDRLEHEALAQAFE